jgi:hypothetical protein
MRRLGFDIETLGLLHMVPLPEITCVCMCDDDGNDYCFRIWNAEERLQHEEEVIRLLDETEIICGYNAVLFDLEYIRRGFVTTVTEAKMSAWVQKCLDPFMYALCISGTPCKLQYMLDINNLASKTASGGDAIVMARDGRWEELLSYCLMDAKLTLALCQLEWIHFTPVLQCKISATTPPQFRFKPQPPAAAREPAAALFPSVALFVFDE